MHCKNNHLKERPTAKYWGELSPRVLAAIGESLGSPSPSPAAGPARPSQHTEQSDSGIHRPRTQRGGRLVQTHQGLDMCADSKNIQICNWKTYLMHESPDKTQGKQTHHCWGNDRQCLKARSLRNHLPQSLMSSLNSSKAGHCHQQDTGFKVRLPKAA